MLTGCQIKSSIGSGSKGSGIQGSAPPPAKKTAGQIEKETDERRTSNVE